VKADLLPHQVKIGTCIWNVLPENLQTKNAVFALVSELKAQFHDAELLGGVVDLPRAARPQVRVSQGRSPRCRLRKWQRPHHVAHQVESSR